MKGRLPMGVLSLVASLGFAQSPPLDDQEVTKRWVKIQIITSGENDTERSAHLKHHGMSQEGARKVAAYVQEATADYNKWASGYRDRVCDQASNLRAGGQEALAQFFEQSRATSASLRRTYLANTLELLTPADQERLEHLISDGPHGPKMQVLSDRPDTASLARTGGLTVEGVLKRNKCDVAEEAKQ